MPKTVRETKNKRNIKIAVFTAILSAIPVLIVLFTGVSSFKKTYGIYVLATLGICLYFSCIFAMFAWKNKVLYIIMDIISVLASLGFVVYAYINSYYRGGLLLHIAAALLFALGVHQTSDADQGDGFFLRYMVPIAIDIAGLIFVLWFISVKMNVIAHIVIVSVIDFFVLAFFLIPSSVKLLRNRSFADIANDELEYEEDTEEEIAAKAKAKAAAKASKKQIDESKKQQAVYEKARKSGQLNADGTVDTRRWQVLPSTIDRISTHFTLEYNSVIKLFNINISSNNSTIDYSDYAPSRESAGRSNKDIERGIRYFKHKLNVVRKNLGKIQNKVFTAQDKYKSFTYGLLSGKLKSTASSEECPSLHITKCRVHYRFEEQVGSETAEMTYAGEDVYLKELND